MNPISNTVCQYAFSPNDVISYGDSNAIQLQLVTNGEAIFLEGRVRNEEGLLVAELQENSNQINWTIAYEDPLWTEIFHEFEGGVLTREQTFFVEELRIGSLRTDDNTPQFVSNFTVVVMADRSAYDFGSQTWSSVSVRVITNPVEVLRELGEAAPIPCSAAACSTDEELFPLPPPWLYADPKRVADPETVDELRGIALQVVYEFLESQLKQFGSGSQQATATAQLIEIIDDLLKEELGVGQNQTVMAAIQRLLCAWCESFLYPGPHCSENPDGVVIGCVSVSGGDITSIDPWGGRRYVMHYLLLAYWGEQLGIVAPDVLASRLMTLICCLSEQPLQQTAAGPY